MTVSAEKHRHESGSAVIYDWSEVSIDDFRASEWNNPGEIGLWLDGQPILRFPDGQEVNTAVGCPHYRCWFTTFMVKSTLSTISYRYRVAHKSHALHMWIFHGLLPKDTRHKRIIRRKIRRTEFHLKNSDSESMKYHNRMRRISASLEICIAEELLELLSQQINFLWRFDTVPSKLILKSSRI